MPTAQPSFGLIVRVIYHHKLSSMLLLYYQIQKTPFESDANWHDIFSTFWMHLCHSSYISCSFVLLQIILCITIFIKQNLSVCTNFYNWYVIYVTSPTSHKQCQLLWWTKTYCTPNSVSLSSRFSSVFLIFAHSFYWSLLSRTIMTWGPPLWTSLTVTCSRVILNKYSPASAVPTSNSLPAELHWMLSH